MSKEKFLYFAYGSNLLKERLKLKNPTAVFQTVAELKDYRLKFAGVGLDPTRSRWKGALATISKENGCSVWGSVWQLGVEDIPHLDRQEDLYEVIHVDVSSCENAKLTCRTYLYDTSKNPKEWDSRPSPQYLDVIIRGACNSKLPPDYIQQLRNLEHNNFSGSVPVYQEVLKSLEEKS